MPTKEEADKLFALASDVEAIGKHTWTEAELKTMYPHPGKFEGETVLTAILYEDVLNGFGNDSDSVYFEGGTEYTFFTLELKGIDHPIYAAVWEDDSGFVHSTVFKSEKEMDDERKRLERDAGKEAELMESDA